MRKSIATLTFAFAALNCMAAMTWHVTKSGSDSNSGKSEAAAFLTIQKAIDSAAKGDEILVETGTYDYITVDADKEPLWIRATGNNSECIIKGAYSHRCVTVGTGTTTNVFVTGFTLTGGYLSGSGNNGAGVMGGTYSNCVITANSSGNLTTAAGAYKCVLRDCVVSNNTCTDWTGGMEDCLAINCVITGNKCTSSNGAGGAKNSILIGCSVVGNSADKGGGVIGCKMYRCVVKENTGSWASEVNGGELYDCLIIATGDSRIMCAASCYNCTIVSSVSSHYIWRDTSLYNCILSGRGGGLSVYGDNNWGVAMKNCFLDTVTIGSYVTKDSCLTGSADFVGDGDYRLQKASACVDAGNNSYSTTDIDLAGVARIYNGTVDIGAYEYHPEIPCDVVNVVASPRYPWNGKVDVRFTIVGESDAKYDTTLVARDLAGGTNLTMKTVYKEDGSAAALTNQLSSGSYRWVWNADADLPDGTELERVMIAVEAK